MFCYNHNRKFLKRGFEQRLNTYWCIPFESLFAIFTSINYTLKIL